MSTEVISISRHVTRSPKILSGELIVVGTRTSVRSIVGLWQLVTMPEEVLNHLPHLTLAQVFDALSFYLGSQSEIDDSIRQNHVPDELLHSSMRLAVHEHLCIFQTGT